MLPASKHVEGLYLGEDGLLKHISPDTVVMECSTIASESARKVAEAAKARGIRMIDAPVSGGNGGAVAGKRTVLVGGEAGTPEAGRACLGKMGQKILHVGDDGSWEVGKIWKKQLRGHLLVGTARA